MGKLRSISLTTICKWATSNLLRLCRQMSQVVFGDSSSLTERRKERLPFKPHLVNAFVWNLYVISPSWQLQAKWRVTGVRAWRLYYGCLRSQEARLRRERPVWCRDLTVYKSVCLKVNRSEEVPSPSDLQVQLDNSIYSLSPRQRHGWQMEGENKRAGCTSADLEVSFREG